MGLQIYYAVISVYGFKQWSRDAPRNDGTSKATLTYCTLGTRTAIIITVALAVLWALLYFVLRGYGGAMPGADAFTAAVGVVATWMTARKYIESWLLWIVANIVSVYLYYRTALYPTMTLYAVYSVLSVVGYLNWKRKGEVN
jgi:nicotinamide mononucleotide transporter